MKKGNLAGKGKAAQYHVESLQQRTLILLNNLHENRGNSQAIENIYYELLQERQKTHQLSYEKVGIIMQGILIKKWAKFSEIQIHSPFESAGEVPTGWGESDKNKIINYFSTEEFLFMLDKLDIRKTFYSSFHNFSFSTLATLIPEFIQTTNPLAKLFIFPPLVAILHRRPPFHIFQLIFQFLASIENLENVWSASDLNAIFSCVLYYFEVFRNPNYKPMEASMFDFSSISDDIWKKYYFKNLIELNEFYSHINPVEIFSGGFTILHLLEFILSKSLSQHKFKLSIPNLYQLRDYLQCLTVSSECVDLKQSIIMKLQHLIEDNENQLSEFYQCNIIDDHQPNDILKNKEIQMLKGLLSNTEEIRESQMVNKNKDEIDSLIATLKGFYSRISLDNPAILLEGLDSETIFDLFWKLKKLFQPKSHNFGQRTGDEVLFPGCSFILENYFFDNIQRIHESPAEWFKVVEFYFSQKIEDSSMILCAFQLIIELKTTPTELTEEYVRKFESIFIDFLQSKSFEENLGIFYEFLIIFKQNTSTNWIFDEKSLLYFDFEGKFNELANQLIEDRLKEESYLQKILVLIFLSPRKSLEKFFEQIISFGSSISSLLAVLFEYFSWIFHLYPNNGGDNLLMELITRICSDSDLHLKNSKQKSNFIEFIILLIQRNQKYLSALPKLIFSERILYLIAKPIIPSHHFIRNILLASLHSKSSIPDIQFSLSLLSQFVSIDVPTEDSLRSYLLFACFSKIKKTIDACCPSEDNMLTDFDQSDPQFPKEENCVNVQNLTNQISYDETIDVSVRSPTITRTEALHFAPVWEILVNLLELYDRRIKLETHQTLIDVIYDILQHIFDFVSNINHENENEKEKIFLIFSLFKRYKIQTKQLIFPLILLYSSLFESENISKNDFPVSREMSSVFATKKINLKGKQEAKKLIHEICILSRIYLRYFPTSPSNVPLILVIFFYLFCFQLINQFSFYLVKI